LEKYTGKKQSHQKQAANRNSLKKRLFFHKIILLVNELVYDFFNHYGGVFFLSSSLTIAWLAIYHRVILL
jgi:hypothetical protein